MGKIINLLAKISGLSFISDKLAGSKTYIAGMAGLLSGLAGLLLEISNLSDMASIIAFAKALPSDMNWLAFLGGLAAIGIRSKLDKSELPK